MSPRATQIVRLSSNGMQSTQWKTPPGSGFGPAGEGYLRLSAFGERAAVEEAVRRIAKLG